MIFACRAALYTCEFSCSDSSRDRRHMYLKNHRYFNYRKILKIPIFEAHVGIKMVHVLRSPLISVAPAHNCLGDSSSTLSTNHQGKVSKTSLPIILAYFPATQGRYMMSTLLTVCITYTDTRTYMHISKTNLPVLLAYSPATQA